MGQPIDAVAPTSKADTIDWLTENMLARTLEPELMDTHQDAVDYDSMDHAAVNRAFVADLLAVCPQPGDVLDLGTGTAQIPIELCRREAVCRVIAADAAVSMLELARYNLEAANLTGRIQLAHVDAKAIEFNDAMFDTVMSNSIVHHIPDPLPALREAVRVTKPVGTLFFRDLLRPNDEASLQQLVDTYTTDCNPHQRQLFADSLHAALSLDEVQAMVVELGFAAESVTQTSDRHWTWFALRV